jgi:hypothetical protein
MAWIDFYDLPTDCRRLFTSQLLLAARRSHRVGIDVALVELGDLAGRQLRLAVLLLLITGNGEVGPGWNALRHQPQRFDEESFCAGKITAFEATDAPGEKFFRCTELGHRTSLK